MEPLTLVGLALLALAGILAVGLLLAAALVWRTYRLHRRGTHPYGPIATPIHYPTDDENGDDS